MSIEWLSAVSLAEMGSCFNHHHGKIGKTSLGAEDKKLKLCYDFLHKHLILKQKKTDTKACTNYDFPIGESFENDCVFKINLSFGLIHVGIQSHPREYMYFVP